MPKKQMISKKIRINIKSSKHECDTCKETTCKNNNRPMGSALFNTIITQNIRTMIKSNTTVENIRKKLIKVFPNYKKKITYNMICSYIKLETGLVILNDKNNTSKESCLKIEYKSSIFIDEAKIVINNKDGKELVVHILCAISSKGLKRLSICLKNRQCAQEFTRSLLKKYNDGTNPLQVIIKSTIEDITEVKRLFTRLSLHTLIFYPRHCQVSNPVSKYIHKLVDLLPKPSEINQDTNLELLFGEAESKITTRHCQKWIERYLHYC